MIISPLKMFTRNQLNRICAAGWFVGHALLAANCNGSAPVAPKAAADTAVPTANSPNPTPNVINVSETPPQDTASDAFSIEVREESYETFVDIHPKGQEAPAFDWRPKSRGLFIKWDRHQARPDQVAPLRAMLVQLHARDGDTLRRATVHLSLDYYTYPEYVERLARFASQDPVWTKFETQKKETAGKSGLGLHNYIKETTAFEDLVPELFQIFAALNAKPHLKGVEKCSQARPSPKGDLGKWLMSKGFVGKKKLPMGCLMAWFELRRST